MQTEELYDASQKRDENGRWAVSGSSGRFDPPNGANPNAAAEHMLASLRAHHDPFESEEWRDAGKSLQQAFRKAVPETAELRTRVPLEKLKAVLADGLLSQHDTGTSQGTLSSLTRDRHEEVMFMVEGSRPKYGYVHAPGQTENDQRYYGTVALVMKDDVKTRTTVTHGDSLYVGQRVAPVPFHDVSQAQPDRLYLAAPDTHGMFGRLYERPQYFETQMHGDITRNDIAKIVTTQFYADEVRAAAFPYGIRVEVVTESTEFSLTDYSTIEQSDFFHAPTVHVLGSISLDVEEFYDPSQRRDRTGKWTSGGGGVSGSPTPRKKAAASGGGKVSGDSTHNPTEFGAKIKRMIEDDPVLAGRPRLSDVDDWVAADKASANVAAEEKLSQTLRDPYRWSISVRPTSDYSTESRGAASNMTIKLRDSLTDGTKKFMDDPDATPANEFEALIQKEIKARLANPLAEWNSGQSANVTVDVGGQPVSIVMTVRTPPVVARRPDVSKMMEDTVDDQFLDSALKVGHVIREEISVRTAARVEMTLAARDVLRERVRELGVDPDSITIYGTSSSGTIVRGKAADGTPLSKEIEDNVAKLLNETDKSLVCSMQGNVEVASFNAAVKARQEAYREVMSEIMPMGGVVAGTPRHKAGRSGLSSNEQAVSGASRYPSSWVDLSGRTGDVNFKKTSNRAHYVHDTNGTGTITLDGRVSTAVHELGHRFERTVPGLYALERRFHARRTDGESSVPLQGVFPGHRYGRDERTFEDDFYHAYAGKVYDNTRAFEVFTVGMEGTSMGTGGNGRKGPRTIDTDHEAFILGALTTLVRP